MTEFHNSLQAGINIHRFIQSLVVIALIQLCKLK